jgi:hypothetical protein
MATLDPKDRRLRPFRIAAWAVYLSVAVSFSLLIVGSVVRSTAHMTPPRPRAVAERLPVEGCVGQATQLFNQLEAERQRLGSAPQVTRADQSWTSFRLDWLTRERELEARCGLDEAGREALQPVFSELVDVLDAYTTATVQFSGGVGPKIEAFRRAAAAATH